MKAADSRRVKLTAHVHYEINSWHHLIYLMAEQPTHLRQIRLCPQMWTGATNSYLTVMGVFCHIPSGQKFVCRIPVGSNNNHWLIRNDNSDSDLTISDLDLEAYVAHLHIFAPIMALMKHIATKVDVLRPTPAPRPTPDPLQM